MELDFQLDRSHGALDDYDMDQGDDSSKSGTTTQRIAELCWTKCNCTRMSSPVDRALLQGNDPPPGFGTWDGELYEWNFDTRSGDLRRRQNGEMAWWKDFRPYPIDLEPDEGEQQLQYCKPIPINHRIYISKPKRKDPILKVVGR